jgi:Protein of unknown function (DUF3515)
MPGRALLTGRARRRTTGRTRTTTRAAVAAPVALAVGAAVLVACGGPSTVTVTPTPAPTGTDRTGCLTLSRALPGTIGVGLHRRTVEPTSPFTAAWGSPPVALSCGVTGLARSYRPDVTLAEVNGVGWFTEDIGSRVRYSTPTRRPQVVLTMPADLQAFEVLVDLSGPVLAATRPLVP